MAFQFINQYLCFLMQYNFIFMCQFNYQDGGRFALNKKTVLLLAQVILCQRDNYLIDKLDGSGLMLQRNQVGRECLFKGIQMNTEQG